MSAWKAKLKPCPSHGRHSWIMHAACVLVNTGVGDVEAMQIIRFHLSREPRHMEIEDALHKARGNRITSRPGTAMRGRIFVKTAAKPAEFDRAKLAAIAGRLPQAGVEWLIQRSPVQVSKTSPEAFLHHLFLPGEQVLVFSDYRSPGQQRWHHRGSEFVDGELREFRKYCDDGVWFLSNPCDGEYRQIERLKKPSNPDGRTRRAEENLTSFRYAVVESDEADPDQWIAALAQMPLPIVSVVSSGGDSRHALVRINATTKAEWDDIVRGRLRRPLTLLGADNGALTAVRLTRLPGCLRYRDGDGNRYKPARQQQLLYLNPLADCTPIADLV